MLGPEASNMDNSGNPGAGAASIRAFEAKNGRAPNADELTPEGALVLGQKYALLMPKSFNDGTHIKFVKQSRIVTQI